ncbi:DNA polymerase III subunit gamma/tau [Clostridium thermosuccinogenes]|uniref:DNA polymerase III subunit gamma/tau n=1 Tax=Clostridium thermosuccinogenes TaxID=84032 RepID=UPI000CCC3F72|nr:DNA polymerase III subunit gamma/tau [Pseudoclostridium thermosuccinogenes]PNT90965.1 DNA polymerase III subunit gamma/tau [Pseudoclostridium thermosuccinogenes]
MSYIALYRKWRPLVFDDVVEQEHVVKTLRYSVTTGRIAHAYLFCGTRGTGKTTMAKIFSRAINCLNPQNGDPCNECEICRAVLSDSSLDVVEIDAASNNSVDNVREIRDEVIYAPSQAKYKVYIIDEVHMLSTGAFNALLKTLEEPPAHVVFILATTDPQKLPATILSRCQRFDFRRITVESMMERLDTIARESGVNLQREASRLIARLSDGALRDAISILDQCMSTGSKDISYDDVLSIVGIVNDSFIGDMFDAVSSRDINKVLGLVETLVNSGKDITQFVSDFIMYFRNVLICSISKNPAEVIEAPTEVIRRMQDQSKAYTKLELTYIIKELSALESSLKWASHPRIMLEVALIKLCELNINVDESNIMDRLSLLENRINSADFAMRKVEVPGADADKVPWLDTDNRQTNAGSRMDNAGGGQDVSSGGEKKAPEKAAKPAKSAKTAGKALKVWDEVLNELKSMGRMVVYTNLLDAKAVELDEKRVGILFKEGSGFCKMILSKAENQEVIETVISKKLGRQVRVKCLDEDDLTENTAVEESPEEDEFIAKAQDIAGRLDIPINIIDE